MRKFLLLLCFVCLTFINAEEEKSYVFEAKGKFAQELKTLVEKYSKEGKVDVTVYESTDEMQRKQKTVTQTLLSAFTRDDAKELQFADINKGQKIYQKVCAKCHGPKAKAKKYSHARVLSTIEPLEIVQQLKGYKENYDGRFGGSTRFLMKPHADALTGTEMQSVAMYIYSLEHGKDLSNFATTKQEEVPVTTSQGSYLK